MDILTKEMFVKSSVGVDLGTEGLFVYASRPGAVSMFNDYGHRIHFPVEAVPEIIQALIVAAEASVKLRGGIHGEEKQKK